MSAWSTAALSWIRFLNLATMISVYFVLVSCSMVTLGELFLLSEPLVEIFSDECKVDGEKFLREIGSAPDFLAHCDCRVRFASSKGKSMSSFDFAGKETVILLVSS